MSPETTKLFNAYVKELKVTRKRAEAWFTRVSEEHKKNPSLPPIRSLWPMGAASHPWIIALVRKYWFLCAELNNREMAVTEMEQPLEKLWGKQGRG